jgi:Ca2+-transporting ATPase
MKEDEQKRVLSLVIGRPAGLVFSRTDPRHKRELVRILTS